MICRTCDASNADVARFCSGCGSELRDRNEPASQLATQDKVKRPQWAANEIGESADAAAFQSHQEEMTQQQSSGGNQEATLVDSARDRLLGCTIAAKYRIDAKLGAGGMGAVYCATRLLIGDEVAVKILHSEQDDPNAAERFRREARAAARLKHSNAVTIHDFGVTDDGLQYLVMELVEGESLRRIIKEQGPLTPSASAEVISQVCAALNEAHRHNIIHRDIKPDNIIVNVTATGLRVKVLDFGIAKLRDDAAGNLTQTGSILGTPHYMSPEQCLGEELDSRSDVYSLGIVLYEMLCGRVPFNSPGSSAVVVQHVNQRPPPLRSLNASISPALERVVLRALEKQLDARPQSAGALAMELSNALNKAGVEVQRTPVPHPEEEPATGTANSGFGPTLVLTHRSSGQGPVTEVLGTSPSFSLDNKPKTRLVWLTALAAIILIAVGGVAALVILKTGNRNGSDGSTQRGQTNATSDADRSTASPLRITATASSVRLPISIANYEARNAVDGRLNTAWIEGVDGPGIGEWIRFDFDRQVDIRALTIAPGYFKSPRIWVQNNRIAAGSLQFSDGTVEPFRFPDRMERQTVAFGTVKTNSVKIVVEEIYFGKDPDTAMSEVSFDLGKGDSTSVPPRIIETASPSLTGGYESVEARIVNGQLIGMSDLGGMSATQLHRLRNTIYARHGRVFNAPELQHYFASRPWYQPRSDYSDLNLTPADKVNANLIMSIEKGAP